MLINDAWFVRGALQSLPSEWAPAGATAQTMPRSLARDGTSAFVSGTAYARSFMAPLGTVFTTLSVVSEQAEAGGTHCWAGILDYQGILRAVSADNTGATFLSGGGATIAFTVTSGGTYTAPYNGPYAMVVMSAFTTTGPTLAGYTLATGIAGIAPAFCGTAGTGFTTPPALGTQFAAISGNGAFNYYGWTA